MKGYKYVDFSRRTAKSNPKMILNEYDRIMSEMRLDIKNLEPARESVNMTELAEYTKFKNPNPGYRGRGDDVHAKFSYQDIKILYHRMTRSHVIYDELKAELILIEHEFNKFRTRFRVHGKY